MKQKIKTSETEQQQPLKALIVQLVQAYAPLQIYQFGKLTKKEQVNSVFCEAKRQMQRTYYLLMLTDGSEAIESDVQDFADRAFAVAKVIVQVHGQATLLKHLNHRNGYFATVINQGKLYYTVPGVAEISGLQQPNPKRRLGRAIVHWRNRSQMANGFFAAAEQAITHGHDHAGVFLLHQAVEQICMGLIFVFMDYQPRLRNLDRLLYLCACFSSKPLNHFCLNKENEMLLKMMMGSVSRQCDEKDFSFDGRIVNVVELVGGFLKLGKGLCEVYFREG